MPRKSGKKTDGAAGDRGAKQARLLGVIEDAIRAAGQPLTRHEIVQATGLTMRQVIDALGYHAGRLVKTGLGTRGNEYRYGLPRTDTGPAPTVVDEKASEQVSVGNYGQAVFPPEHRRGIEYALGFLAHRCAATGLLRNGETALYWHLVGVVAGHMVDGRPGVADGQSWTGTDNRPPARPPVAPEKDGPVPEVRMDGHPVVVVKSS